MVSFQNSEERQRHRSIDAFLASTNEAVQDSVFKDAFPDAYQSFDTILNTFAYVPNVVHGEAQVPKKHQTSESIPILGVFPDETITVAASGILSMHARQKLGLLEYVAAVAPKNSPSEHRVIIVETVEEIITKSIKPASVSIPPNTAARVYTPHGPVLMNQPSLGGNQYRSIRTRPFMAIPLKKADRPHDAMVGIHELTHIVQSLTVGPTKIDIATTERGALRNELEAYSTQVNATKALFRFSQNRQYHFNNDLIHPFAFEIDAIREAQNANRKDPFEPTGTIRKEIAKRNGFDLIS